MDKIILLFMVLILIQLVILLIKLFIIQLYKMYKSIHPDYEPIIILDPYSHYHNW